MTRFWEILYFQQGKGTCTASWLARFDWSTELVVLFSGLFVYRKSPLYLSLNVSLFGVGEMSLLAIDPVSKGIPPAVVMEWLVKWCSRPNLQLMLLRATQGCAWSRPGYVRGEDPCRAETRLTTTRTSAESSELLPDCNL